MNESTSTTTAAASPVVRVVAEAIHDASRATVALREALTAITADDDSLRAVASQSYAHDNGFHKIVLYSVPDVEQLRLHVWESVDGPRKHGNIHSHRWAFTSAVLAGALHYEEFRYASEGEEVDHYAYAPREMSYELSSSGTRRIACSDAGTRAAGTVYSLTEETLHRTWASDRECTITVVLQKESTRASADVLSPRLTPLDGEHEIRAMTAGELRAVIATVLTMLV
jgi:hypothetical protein